MLTYRNSNPVSLRPRLTNTAKLVGNLGWYDIWDILANSDPLVHCLQNQLEQRGKLSSVYRTP
jgi:hypothetical protein